MQRLCAVIRSRWIAAAHEDAKVNAVTSEVARGSEQPAGDGEAPRAPAPGPEAASNTPHAAAALAPALPTQWRSRAPWHIRLFDTISAYLPLLLMAALAMGTWWLVKNTPLFDNDRVL